MCLQPQTCDRDLLQRSLDDRLPEREEEELARHLAECAHCQRELERLSGGEEAWAKIGAMLAQSSPLASRETAISLAEREGNSADQDDYLDADFAVDFLEPSSAPEALGRLGDIDILEVIGRGGMGVVLKGHQSELKRLVAVKVLGPHLAASGAARKRFAREAQAAAAIVHANVMPILTVSSGHKLPYLVMPYVACESLQQRIDRTGPLETPDLLRIGVQVARGLAAAHAQGLVHRDIKPANILLERGVERAMLTDFGLARAIDDASLTRTGLIAGTPQYMSPEQAKGEPVDARSDLFSLGSVLYTIATGRPPFRAESTYGILRRITDSPHRPIRDLSPQIPEWLAAIVDKLLAKEPAGRFATADELATLLEQCLAHVQQPNVVPLPAGAKLPKEEAPPPRKNWLRLAIWSSAAAMVLVAAVWIGVTAFNNRWPTASQKLPNPDPNHPAASAPETSSDPIQTDWHEAAGRLNSLEQDGDKFEQRAKRLWDHEPSNIDEEIEP